MSDSSDANGNNANYPLTNTWTRFVVSNCFPGSSLTSLLFSVAYLSANSSTATVDLWGAQLSQTASPLPYVKTTTVAVTSANVGAVTPSLQGTGANPAGFGLLRDVNNNTTIAARNAANSADVAEVGTDASDNVVLGGH